MKFLLLFGLFLVSATAQAQSVQVYQKLLPDNSRLIVLQKETAYIPPPELKAWWPEARLIPPDHVYLYTFQLQNGQKTKVIWSRKMNHFSWFSAESAMKVLDAIISKGKLCVVYKQGGMTEANIITPGAPLDKPGIGWHDAILIRDSDPQEIFIASAIMTGSLEKNDLAVELKNSDAKRYRYHLANKKWLPEASVPDVNPPGLPHATP